MAILIDVYSDPSIDPSTVDGGQLSSTSPPQPIFTPPVRAQYSASSKRIHGFPVMEKLPMANSSALPSSVNHSNTVSISSDVEVYDSKTDYLKKLPSSRAIIYPHTTAYPSSSGFLQLNGAPPKISTTGHHNHDTSAPKTLDTNDIHSVIIDPNDPKAGETRPSSSPCTFSRAFQCLGILTAACLIGSFSRFDWARARRYVTSLCDIQAPAPVPNVSCIPVAFKAGRRDQLQPTARSQCCQVFPFAVVCDQ